MLKIRHIKHSEVDKKAYDDCIEHSLQGTVYAMSWYLDVVSPGWDMLMADHYRWVMPIPVKKRWFLKYAVQPRLCQQLGVFSLEPLTQEVFTRFIESLPFSYFNLQLNAGNVFEFPNRSLKSNYLLDLNRSYETIQAGYTNNCLKNIKKGEKGNLIVSDRTDPETYVDLLVANSEKRPIRQMIPLLENLLKISDRQTKTEIWHVKDSSQSILTCVFFLYWKNRVYYLVPFSTPEGKQKQSMSFLIDRFIQTHASSRCVLDFEGSSMPGIARYYKGFGSISESYPQIKKRNLFSRFQALVK